MNLTIQLIGHFFFMVLMIVFLIIGIIKVRQKGANWLLAHRGIVLAGVLSGIVAFLFMFIAKVIHGYPHFASNHSKGGLVSLILLLITPVLGTMLMKQKLKTKLIHQIFGYFTLAFCCLAAVFGVIMVLSK